MLALDEAARRPGLGRLGVEERREQRAGIASFHADLYEGLLA